MHLFDDRARNAKKLEPLAALAAGVAREFNDELTVLINGLRQGADSIDRKHAAAEPLRDAQSAALRCAAIANRLLEFTRNLGSRNHNVRLEALMQEAERRARA